MTTHNNLIQSILSTYRKEIRAINKNKHKGFRKLKLRYRKVWK